MLARQDVLSTLRMVREEHLDVRAVTLGINLNVCANPDPERLACGVYERIVAKAGPLVRFCDEGKRQVRAANRQQTHFAEVLGR